MQYITVFQMAIYNSNMLISQQQVPLLRQCHFSTPMATKATNRAMTDEERTCWGRSGIGFIGGGAICPPNNVQDSNPHANSIMLCDVFCQGKAMVGLSEATWKNPLEVLLTPFHPLSSLFQTPRTPWSGSSTLMNAECEGSLLRQATAKEGA